MNRRGIVVLIGALLALGFVIWAAKSQARDLDAHYATQNPGLHAWFNGLASGRGLCCSFADGVSIKNVDWGTEAVAAGGKTEVRYWVMIGGVKIDVPPQAVVTGPNKFGAAVVWPYVDADGVTQIRCFLPGAGA